jgi:geranylgeranylglycerol-phosphate geranylgeranyltransferase
MLAKLRAIWKLTRFEHALMLGIAVVIGIAIGAKEAGVAAPGLQTIALAALVSILVEMGAFAQNDVADEKADRENRRKERPIVSGEISAAEANIVAWAAYGVGCAIAYSLGNYPFAIAVFFTAVSIAYNFKLKDIALAGNACIAASMAIPFAFGSIVSAGGAGAAALAITAVAFVAGLGREVAKTVEDMKGDRKARGSRTIPFVIGRKNALLLSAILFALAVPLSAVPFVFGLKANLIALTLVALTDLGFLYFAYLSADGPGEKEIAKIRKLSLAAVGIGLLGYLAAAVI